MARRCDICGKGPLVGNNVSLPNLRSVRASVDGSVRHVRVCTRCLKAGRITKAPHHGARASARA
jgi:large subunit ribosomal protein L28